MAGLHGTRWDGRQQSHAPRDCYGIAAGLFVRPVWLPKPRSTIAAARARRVVCCFTLCSLALLRCVALASIAPLGNEHVKFEWHVSSQGFGFCMRHCSCDLPRLRASAAAWAVARLRVGSDCCAVGFQTAGGTPDAEPCCWPMRLAWLAGMMCTRQSSNTVCC